jgi:hypothetical protein
LLIFLLSVSLSSVISVLASNPAFANHREDVLGVASAPALSIPPTAEGPGLILPNSPLYFVDQIKQEFRLLLAFTPEQKAKIHNQVAGERLAELRIMLIKNDALGIRTALQRISDNLKSASENLADAKLTGRNINTLAEEINNSIKEKQRILSVLETQATGEIKVQVTAAREGLKIAKAQVEEDLPTDQLVNETISDLNQQIDDNINSASQSGAEINRAIDVLTKLASEGAVQKHPEIKNVISEFQKAQNSLSKENSAVVISKPAKK